MAAGDGARWGNYQGIPKHLIKIGEETLLGRTTRLLDEDCVITCREGVYSEYGPTIDQSHNDCEVDRFEDTGDEEICYLYGDVYYTEEAMRTIKETPANDVLFFGSKDEIFAIKVVDRDMFFTNKEKVKELYLKGKIDRCIGWEVYRSINGIDFNTHEITDRYVLIEDGTDDIDFPEDYERFRDGYINNRETKFIYNK